MFKITRREFCYGLSLFLLIILLLTAISSALRPLRKDYGATWSAFLSEPKNSMDYLYFGSSYAYCAVNPSMIYDETQLTGYVMAGPEQTLAITYWYLKETLLTQSPSMVFIEASALNFNTYEGYSQINVSYMPRGNNRFGASMNAIESDLKSNMIFELSLYHDLWKEVTAGNLANLYLGNQPDHLKGFTAVSGVFDSIANGPFDQVPKSNEQYNENMDNLLKIIALCESENIPVAVVYHPTYSQFTDAYYAQVASDITSQTSALFFNWSNLIEEIGIVPTGHFFDPGHLNVEGANIFSRWLGNFMSHTLELVPQVQNVDNIHAWESASHYWNTK